MPPTRTTKTSPITYAIQATAAIVTITKQQVPQGQPISFDDLMDEVRHNVAVCGDTNGPRAEHYVFASLSLMEHRRKLLVVDLELKTFQVTPAGQTKFQIIRNEMGATHSDERAELIACFQAIKEQMTPMKGLTNREILIMYAREQRLRKRERQAFLIVRTSTPIRQDPPAYTSGKFSNGTPLHKAFSMDVYPTPVSLPRHRRLLPALLQSPPPSPTPQTSSAMEIDDVDASMDYSGPQPTQLQIDLQAKLAAVAEAELLECQQKLAATEQENQRLLAEHQAQIAELEAQRLQDRNYARIQVKYLKDKIESGQVEIKEMRLRVVGLEKQRDERKAQALRVAQAVESFRQWD
ncbi:hypothetical protein DFH09DRAFT_1140661 [Mycena vulgaris]|nr:hypothetical protein DFH09DRAFT_1140661 [Mycena vulgaris]